MYLKPRFFFRNKNNNSSLLVTKRQKIPNHGDKWRNQEGLKGLQPPLAKSLRNITPKFKGLYNPTNSKPPPPQKNLVARLIADLMILNPCPYTDENYEGPSIF